LDAPTSDIMRKRLGYCFATPPGSQYPPILAEHRLTPGEAISVEGAGGAIAALPIRQLHGDIDSIGFRFGDVAYSCDLSDIPGESVAAFAGLDVWIVDALRYTPHPSHLSLAETLDWIERPKPRRAILTNLHSYLYYEVLRTKLPPHVEPGFDGLSFTAAAS